MRCLLFIAASAFAHTPCHAGALNAVEARLQAGAAASLAPQAHFHVVHALASGREWEMQMADLEPAVIRKYVDIDSNRRGRA
jgi:hypothetical protein